MEKLFIFFGIIALIALFMTIVTIIFCIIAGAKANDYSDRQIKMICLDCGKVFNMKEYEEHCCCPYCLKDSVEIIKEK